MAKRARPKRAKKTKPRAVKAKRIKAEPIKAKPVKAEPIKAKIAPAPPPQPAAEPEPEPEAAREPAPPPPAAAAAKALSVRSAVHPAVAAGMIKKVEGYGSLRVVTGAREGRVFVDGNLRGAGEAVVLKNIPVGTHRITVEKEGNKLPHQDVQIMADQRLDVSF